MKYPSIKAKKHLYEKFELSGGINGNNDENVFKGQLKSSKNLTNLNGVLKSREGIFPLEDSFIGNHDSEGHIKIGLTVTDTVFIEDGKSYKIGYQLWENNSNFEILYVYKISEDFTVSLVEKLDIYPTYNDYYKFKNVFFIVGKRSVGSGLFAFLTRYSEISSQTIYEIYEHNPYEHEFTQMNGENFYIPVIYTNGRGSRYEEAKKLYNVFNEAPESNESVNMLGGGFGAYFSSDGLSSEFKLPITDIRTEEYFECYFYDYESALAIWVIPPNQTSVTAKLSGENITLTIDRTFGVLRFSKNSLPYSLPIKSLNNLVVFGYQYTYGSLEKIAGSKDCAYYNSKFFLYGNDKFQNELYCCEAETPLYFPIDKKIAIGNPDNKITSVKHIGGKIVAIKHDGIYKIASNNEKLSSSFYFAGNELLIEEFKNTTATELNRKSGTVFGNTVKLCNDKLVFFDGDHIYCVSESGKTEAVSNPVKHIINSLSLQEKATAFSAVDGSHYILFFGNKSLCLNFVTPDFGIETKNTAIPQAFNRVSWNYLEFPDSLTYNCAVNLKNRIALICRNNASNFNFLSLISGNTDKIPQNAEPYTWEDKKIDCCLESYPTDLGYDGLKNIISLNMQICGSGDISVYISGDEYKSTQTLHLNESTVNDVKIMPFFMPVKNISVALSGNAPVKLNKVVVEYEKI